MTPNKPPVDVLPNTATMRLQTYCAILPDESLSTLGERKIVDSIFDYLIKRGWLLTRVHPVNQQMLEALKMADAALSGANMNMKVVEKKIKAAITAAERNKG